MESRRYFLLSLLLFVAGATQVARSETPQITRTHLQQHDPSQPGRELVQVRVDFAPGAAFGAHRHPGEEIVYVIEGELEYEVEGRAPVTLAEGEVMFIPAGTVHAARNVRRANGAELATYLVDKGAPLVELVE